MEIILRVNCRSNTQKQDIINNLNTIIGVRVVGAYILDEDYQKMTFEEEFPGLKDKCLSDVDYEPPIECDEYFTSKDFVWVKDVKKYCLDKQRVREVLEEEVLNDIGRDIIFQRLGL